jgi:hypothetical protein
MGTGLRGAIRYDYPFIHIENEIAAPETGTRRCVIRREGMIRKSVKRFSEKIMPPNSSLDPRQPCFRFGVIVSGFVGLADGV